MRAAARSATADQRVVYLRGYDSRKRRPPQGVVIFPVSPHTYLNALIARLDDLIADPDELRRVPVDEEA